MLNCEAHLATVSLFAMSQIRLVAIVRVAALVLVAELGEALAAFGRAMAIVLAKT